MDAIKRACEIVGSQTALAKLLGVTPGYVNQWVSGHRQIPADYCPAIEAATNGVIRCEQMRPDVGWSYLRATDCPVDKKAA